MSTQSIIENDGISKDKIEFALLSGFNFENYCYFQKKERRSHQHETDIAEANGKSGHC